MSNYDLLSREELVLLAIAQQAEIESLRTCPIFGVLTRSALEANPPCNGAVVFWDIDNMKLLNAQLGYEGLNVRIRAACDRIRSTDSLFRVARWFSGDEFVLFCPAEDAVGAAERVQRLFEEQGISITLAIAEVGQCWKGATVEASSSVQVAKEQGRRGSINY